MLLGARLACALFVGSETCLDRVCCIRSRMPPTALPIG
jgi:hypothetical protein